MDQQTTDIIVASQAALRQALVAARLETTWVSVWRWENGLSTPTPDHARRLTDLVASHGESTAWVNQP